MMMVRYVSLLCDMLYITSLRLTDVQIGFEESIYSVSERDMSVSVCAEVKEGTLGIPVSMSFSTTSHNARGTGINPTECWCDACQNLPS